MKTKIFATLVGAACLGMAIGAASRASASGRFVHAATCFAEPQYTRFTTDVGAQIWNPNNFAVDLVCPFDSDNLVKAKSTAAQVYVDVYSSGANGVQAESCITYAGGGGGNCDFNWGGTENTGGVGVYRLGITPFAWINGTASDYAYVRVRLGASSSGTGNVLFGYTVTN